ncbi:hypothetical protein [uncultured Psychroserpens sp.]|uniref:hypothetical protein n=1 Tax=uncultured Psychroserpens sp. TaxID=255436 RepID=UPI002639B2F3|nr:hypothetical protein [uncultured Psychroserpens sp.]
MKPLIFLLFFYLAINSNAQNKPVSDTLAVNSIDGILTEMLNIISGEEGKKRDWEAFKNLFLPTATFTVFSNDKNYDIPIQTANLEDFIESMKDVYYDRGFEEYELGKVVEEYNGLASVFQSFYGKDSEGTEERGINSYHLINHKGRWWIANMVWTFESEDYKIPEKYLQKN